MDGAEDREEPCPAQAGDEPRLPGHKRTGEKFHPALAGMYHYHKRPQGRHEQLPRTRGDEPRRSKTGRERRNFPPRTRG